MVRLSPTAVATVSPAGLVTAQGYGGTTITASYQGATTVFPFLVSLAGTWISAAADGSTLTWVLTQSQGIVSGTFSIAPLGPGNSLSTATIGGTVSNSTFTWTMMATVGSDTSRPECAGTTPIISGTAGLTSAGTSMNATIQAVNGICNPRLAASLAVDAVLAFKKQ